MSCKNNDYYYLVKLDMYKVEDALWYKTTCETGFFCGKLVNHTGSNFYFELNCSNALVIIPHNWIKWMAPSRVLWNKKESSI